MGIPAFFRWMVDKYNGIIVPTKEPRHQDGSRVVCDNSEPNLNGEFDNLYLDMNGIIHPCAHPEQGPKPRNTQDMMDSIMEYLDLVFAIVRPRNLLYMAIDGVAPRAKMNQQRSRRFRSALDARLTREKEAKELMENIANGKMSESEVEALQKAKDEKFHFDSNCITPGTMFMDLVALTLRSYVAEKVSTDPAWKNLKVIISDASIPGEGEHKIMDYIRKQRAQKDYNPNQKNVIYGLDADLIMLALATHEPNFEILREFVQTKGRKQQSTPKEMQGGDDGEEEKKDFLTKDYQLLSLNLFRDYLDSELKCSPAFGFDIERVIDDFILICFFVGNDFLPHLPSLQINEGAIDRIMKIYKDLLPTFDDYLTEDGEFSIDRVGKIFAKLAMVEEDIMMRRKSKEEAMIRRKARMDGNFQQLQEDPQSLNLNSGTTKQHQEAAKNLLNEIFTETDDTQRPNKKLRVEDGAANKSAAAKIREELLAQKKGTTSNKDAAKQLQQSIVEQSTTAPADGKKKGEKRGAKVIEIMEVPVEEKKLPSGNKKRKHGEEEEEEQSNSNGGEGQSLESSTFIDRMKDVKIGTKGWRERYYNHHFESEAKEDDNVVLHVCQSYIDGLAWVLKYYYKGCASWGWYYPYHYAPFIIDISENIELIKPATFDLGSPFRPFEQLMSVLPKESGQFVPKPYQKMMGIDDGSGDVSPIIHFYPSNFMIDVQPSQPIWKGVCLLPFIDEKELLSSLKSLENKLTDEEKFRNSQGAELLIVNKDLKLTNDENAADKDHSSIDSKVSPNFLGDISKLPERITKKLPPMQSAIAYSYENPAYPEGYVFKSEMLPNAVKAPRTDITSLRFSIQNSAANRMINHAVDSNQYKNKHFNRNQGYNNQNNNYNKNYNNQNNNYNNNNYNNNNNNYNNQYQNNNNNYNNNNNNYSNQNYNNNYIQNNNPFNNNNSNYNQNNNYNNNNNYNQNYNNNSNMNYNNQNMMNYNNNQNNFNSNYNQNNNSYNQNNNYNQNNYSNQSVMSYNQQQQQQQWNQQQQQPQQNIMNNSNQQQQQFRQNQNYNNNGQHQRRNNNNNNNNNGNNNQQPQRSKYNPFAKLKK
ncbi:5'-3' exoribonuclease [Heterostelium album PN500]|uniref:5'-3' exoribonuclease n=1 Tax=Heterostelium pallidum (strain ATCC 26659 / Pp 5 / PN500) TaxID=670386 RepID=D3BP61_HETP5|nr:5'-3' exoribonuclease [Heterostelium album PN500]EFA77071.1 5'-3' exoribonuclease [Heterostelium album PN500]|eukprot:XP_020429200.1 5'-3' exoribonuclease [Heterostelium album PN500]